MRKDRHAPLRLVAAAAALLPAFQAPVRGEEIRLYDNTQVNAMIENVTPEGVRVTTMEGDAQTIPLADILTIAFRGREPRMLLAGAEELRLGGGDRLLGMLKGTRGDELVLDTFCAGTCAIDVRCLKGFVTMPQMGRIGREAEELVEGPPREGEARFLDVVLDRRGSRYEGALRKVSEEGIDVDHDELQKNVFIPSLYLAGGRFADATRAPDAGFPTNVLLRAWTRDGSYLNGWISRIELGNWILRPLWSPERPLPVAENEMVTVQVLNARRMYLSQLTPIRVRESAGIAPPQPYRMDRSCQDDPLTIASHSYPWGIGVHANSELTFRLGRSFKRFECLAGIDSHSGDNGSVVFTVSGDGRTLYQSPVVRGSDAEPHEIAIGVEDVDELTLKVDDAGDTDLGDMAYWAIAQLVR